MTNRLEELKKEALESLDEMVKCRIWSPAQLIQNEVERTYRSAIEDAIGSLPAKYLEAAVNPHSLHLKQVRNKVLEEAITNITNLLPQQ